MPYLCFLEHVSMFLHTVDEGYSIERLLMCKLQVGGDDPGYLVDWVQSVGTVF